MNQVSITTFKIEDFFSPDMVKMIRNSDKFQSKLKGIDQTMSKTVGGLKGKMAAFAQGNSQMISGITDQMPMLGGNLAMLANPYAAGAAAAIAAGTLYVQAGKMAGEWEKSMAKVNVTAGLGKPALADLSDQILNIGKRSRGTDLMEVPEAFNRIISAGLDVNTSLRALEPTLMASKAGFTDIETTATAAVSVMNSSGISDATRVYDILFATLNKGNAEFKDIAQYLPKIIPTALSVGFSLEQTAGAYAYLTAQGQTAERSTTLLENSFKALSDPSKIKNFKAIGVSLYDTKGKMQPLVSIADQLHNSLSGLTDIKRSKVLDSLGLDMEAKGGLLALSQDTGKLKSIIDATTNSQGDLSQAYKDSATSGDTWREVMNQGKAMMISVGNTALPIWNKLGQGVLDLITWTRNLYNENLIVRDIISGIGTVFEIAMTVAFTPLKRIWNLVMNIGDALGWIGGKVGLAGGGFTSMYTTIRPYLMWMYEILAKIADIGFKMATLDFRGAFSSIKNFELPDINKLKQDTAKELKPTANGKLPLAVEGGDKKKTSDINKVITAAGGSVSGGSGSGSGSGRSVQVTINKLVEKIEIHVVQAGRDSYRDMERTITEVLTKAVRDSEIALSSD